MKLNRPVPGGIAALGIFAIGLLLTGKTWAGIVILGLGLFVIAITLSPPAITALLIALGTLICGGILAYHAVSNEFTGKAVYYYHWGRYVKSEPVTRASSPAKFREGTNLLWGLSGVAFMAAAASFKIHSLLDD